MKKLLLLLLSVAISLTVNSQNLRKTADVKVKPASCGSKAMRAQKASSIRDVSPLRTPVQASPARNPVMHSVSSTLTEAIIGNTVYDLQANRGTAKRISNNGDGTLSAIWTLSNIPGSFSDRGTGYNYYNGINWNAAPTISIDPIRTGFPNIDYTPQAGEHVVSHTSANGMMETFRTTKGTGPWDTTLVGSYNLLPAQADVWSRMALGGANGNSVHVIVNSQGTGTTPVLGQNGPLTYSRSLDGGVTWIDDHIQLPGDDATNYYGVGADEYHIDARGDVIAIVVGGNTHDVVLYKSTDNGATWTKTIILAFPIPLYDVNTMNTDTDGDGVADTIESNAGDVTVTIDNNNIAHIAYGRTRVYEDPGGTAISYFPTDDGLMYWNENMGAASPIMVAAAEDFNANGFIDIPQNPTGVPYGPYNIGFTGQPSIGIDGSNRVYIAYATIDERADTTAYQQALRHVFLIASSDYGLTWSVPFSVVPDPAGNGAFQEAVFPSIATLVDNNVHIVYQRDPAPGTSLSTDPMVAANNSNPSDIVYAEVSASMLTQYNTITGNCFLDDNQNGIRDTNESGFNDLWVYSTGGYSASSQPDINGNFSNYADTGTTITTIQNLQYYSATPSQHVSTFTTYNNIDTINFAIVPKFNTIKGNCFLDNNQNGIRDTNENGYNDLLANSIGGYSFSSKPDMNGDFINYADTGSTLTTFQNLLYHTITPPQYTSNFTTYNNIDSVAFAVVPIPGIEDLSLSLIPLNPARPGFNTTYSLVYRNLGTATLNGAVTIVHDLRQTYVSATAPVTYTNGDTLQFTYSNLVPNEVRSIDVTLLNAVPPTLNINDILSLNAYITPLVTDTNPENNGITINQNVQGSYDPNDKSMLGGAYLSPSQVVNGDFLHYLIRFQNTGNDTAFTVIVKDTLSANLNWNSLEMETASHPYSLTIKDGNILKWQFNNINLADSNVNEPASHGYIAYKIKPINTLSLGNVINNTAYIYFDFNPPVVTNTATSAVSNVGINEIQNNELHAAIYPNPTSGSFTIDLDRSTDVEVKICNVFGQLISHNQYKSARNISGNINGPKGVYFLHLTSEKGNAVLRIVKQ